MELRAEVENYSARISDLRAENDSWQEAMLDLTERFRQSQVEIERLRAALRNLLAYTVKANVYTDRSPTIHEAEDALGDA